MCVHVPVTSDVLCTCCMAILVFAKQDFTVLSKFVDCSFDQILLKLHVHVLMVHQRVGLALYFCG